MPSTAKQLVFAKYLKEELEREGLSDVEMDEMGYIYATLKANTKKEVPTIGFIAHYDTSMDCSGANIKPRIVENYDGGDIVLSEGIVSSATRCSVPTTRRVSPRLSRRCAICATTTKSSTATSVWLSIPMRR